MRKERRERIMFFEEVLEFTFSYNHPGRKNRTSSLNGCGVVDKLHWLIKNIDLVYIALDSKESSFSMNYYFSGYKSYIIRSSKSFLRYFNIMCKCLFETEYNSLVECFVDLLSKYKKRSSYYSNICTDSTLEALITSLYKGVFRTELEKKVAIDFSWCDEVKYWFGRIESMLRNNPIEYSGIDFGLLRSFAREFFINKDLYFNEKPNVYCFTVDYTSLISLDYLKAKYNSLYLEYEEVYASEIEKNKRYTNSYNCDISFWGSHYSDD